MSNVPLFVWPVGPIINTEPIRYVVNKTDHDLVVEALREQNRVLATKLSEAAVLAKEIKDEFDMCTHECERCGESDPMTTFDIYGTVVKLAALTATSQPTKPQGRMHACDIPGCVSCGNPEDATSQEGQHG